MFWTYVGNVATTVDMSGSRPVMRSYSAGWRPCKPGPSYANDKATSLPASLYFLSSSNVKLCEMYLWPSGPSNTLESIKSFKTSLWKR